MKFNTAVFYDIENLIGGYSLTNVELLNHLSLKLIAEQIKQSGIGEIAIHRAYADWSLPRLSQLKQDIVELGITPVHIFGFGRGITRNASDIHLAIDTIEAAITKPDIEIFVIVSGDGGFSSLASKLHEYGKTVIGCGYRKNVNKVYESIADDFIWLNENGLPELNPNAPTDDQHNRNGYFIAYSRKYSPLKENSEATVKKVSQEIIDFLITNPYTYSKLNEMGINVSVFMELLKYRVPDFNQKEMGFARSIDFIKAAVKHSQMKIIVKNGCDFRLAMKNNSIYGYTDAENNSTDEHTVDNYRHILSEGSPSFRQFDKQIIKTISDYLCKHPLRYRNSTPEELERKLSEKLDIDTLETIKTVSTLMAADCFETKQHTNLLAQKINFIPINTDQTFAMLEKAMAKKIRTQLKTEDANIMDGIYK